MNAFPSEFDGLDERLSAYLDGDLSPVETAQVEALLAEREDYRALLAELRSLRENVLALPRVKASPNFYDRVLAAVGQAKIEDLPAKEKEPERTPAAPIAAPSASPAAPPRSAWPAPIWGLVAAGAVAASIGLALIAPSWFGREGEQIGQNPEPGKKPDMVSDQPAQPVAPSAAKPQVNPPQPEVARMLKAPREIVLNPPAPPNANGAHDARQSKNPTELAKADRISEPDIARTKESVELPARRNREAKGEAIAPPAAALATADAKFREQAKKGAEEVVYVELRLPRKSASREALNDLFAWQGLSWGTEAPLDETTAEERKLAADRRPGFGRVAEKGEGRGEGKVAIAAAPGAPAREMEKALGDQASVELFYLETTPDRWTEMRSLLAQWDGATLAQLDLEDSMRKSPEIDKAKLAPPEALLRQRQMAEARTPLAPGAGMRRGLDADGASGGAGKPANVAAAPAAPALPKPQPKEIAANPGDANPAKPGAAGNLRDANPLIHAGLAEQKGLEAERAETEGIAAPYSPAETKQLAGQLLRAKRFAGVQRPNAAALERQDGKERQAAADKFGADRGEGANRFFALDQAQQAKDASARVRVVLMIRSEDAPEAKPADEAPPKAEAGPK